MSLANANVSVAKRKGGAATAGCGRGTAHPAALQRVVNLLAAFYAASPPAISQTGALGRRLLAQSGANRAVLAALDREAAENLWQQQRSILVGLEALLDARAARGCVIEAHGDLRPEHIALSEPPAVIDCLEFDRELRILDRAEELCFLELECARLGHAVTGRWLLDTCLQRLSDDAPPRLLDFYRSHRAATRAKLYTWRAGEPDGGTPTEWRARAARYLDTAVDAARAALG